MSSDGYVKHPVMIKTCGAIVNKNARISTPRKPHRLSSTSNGGNCDSSMIWSKRRRSDRKKKKKTTGKKRRKGVNQENKKSSCWRRRKKGRMKGREKIEDVGKMMRFAETANKTAKIVEIFPR